MYLIFFSRVASSERGLLDTSCKFVVLFVSAITVLLTLMAYNSTTVPLRPKFAAKH